MSAASFRPGIVDLTPWPMPLRKYCLPRSVAASRLGAAEVEDCTIKIAQFDAEKPVEAASTPPSSWYWSPSVASLEMSSVFGKGWQAAGYSSQVEHANEFFTGSLGSVPYLVCRDEHGQLHAFHNVCRHHAAPVATGQGCAASFVCPYHGWTYNLDGKLRKATRISGIQNFNAKVSLNGYFQASCKRFQETGLVPIQVSCWGPFILINLDSRVEETPVGVHWLGTASDVLVSSGIDDDSLRHVARREYIINCNWKVYCDNYLDGGYHVPYAHPGLASGLDMASYMTELYEKVSIQSCRAKVAEERLGERATYAFVYPNFMINRYGPWMDTNLVLPVAPSKCRVVFDYFLEQEQSKDEEFIAKSLVDSDQVQIEDVILCEQVQSGLESPAYNAGRYAPKVELAMHHFHRLLHADLLAGLRTLSIR